MDCKNTDILDIYAYFSRLTDVFLFGRAGAAGGSALPPTAVRAYAIRPYSPAPTIRVSLLPRRRAIRSNDCTIPRDAKRRAEPPSRKGTHYVNRKDHHGGMVQSFPLLSLSRRPHRKDVCVCQNLHRRPFSHNCVPPLTGARENGMGRFYRAFAPTGALRRG